jgi:L-histidine Nalpha-methyltransferase / hercynylcysteine S-oxide synthase
VPEEGKWPSVEVVVAYEESVRERVKKVYREEEGRWTRRLARVMMMVSLSIAKEQEGERGD